MPYTETGRTVFTLMISLTMEMVCDMHGGDGGAWYILMTDFSTAVEVDTLGASWYQILHIVCYGSVLS